MEAYHPGFRAQVRYARYSLSDDPDTAVAQTIGLMGSFVREDSKTVALRRLAAQLGAGSPAFVENCFAWIKSRLTFVQDARLAEQLRVPRHSSGFLNNVAEVLIRPVDMLRMANPQGDCDDFSMLGAALMLAGGVPAEFVTLAADPRAPDQFSHVYLLAGGVPFDSSHGPRLGWEAKNRYGKRAVWSVDQMMYRASLGQDTIDVPTFGDPGFSLPGFADPNFNPAGTLPGGGIIVPTGGGGGIPAGGLGPTPWWQGDINAALSAALSIFKARYAVPPSGTVITTKQGTVATGVAPGTVIGTQSSLFGQIPIWIWAVAAIAIVMLIARRR